MKKRYFITTFTLKLIMTCEHCKLPFDEDDEDSEQFHCAHRTFCSDKCSNDSKKYEYYFHCPYCILLGSDRHFREEWDSQYEVVTRGIEFYEWAISEGASGKEDFTTTAEFADATKDFYTINKKGRKKFNHPFELFFEMYKKGHAIGSASLKIAQMLKVRSEMMNQLFEATGCPPNHWRYFTSTQNI